MLIDHAEAERVRLARARDVDLAVADHDAAAVGPVIAHDAFDERRFAGAVLAEQRVNGARLHAHRHGLERDEVAEPLADVDRLDGQGRGGGHAMSRMRSAERPTAPKTPPCILTILTAWS